MPATLLSINGHAGLRMSPRPTAGPQRGVMTVQRGFGRQGRGRDIVPAVLRTAWPEELTLDDGRETGAETGRRALLLRHAVELGTVGRRRRARHAEPHHR